VRFRVYANRQKVDIIDGTTGLLLYPIALLAHKANLYNSMAIK
jgi:hypothetical protein